MSTAVPQFRQQSSLEGLIDLTDPSSKFSSEEGRQARRVFTSIIEACEPLQDQKPYKPISLIRLTYEYSLSERSKDNFLQFFFQHTQIPIDGSQEQQQGESTLSHHVSLGPQLVEFADLLVEKFFLPMKASSRKTPQPTPASLSDIVASQSLAGTSRRLASLRRDCLVRDRHRCVISRAFDRVEAGDRVKRDGTQGAKDDDGIPLGNGNNTFAILEVAHIMPHSLMALSRGEPELNESKRVALAILNMFDDGITHLIEGSEIDRTRNAITLTTEFHQLFGNFEVYFEPKAQSNEANHQPIREHTYRIDSLRRDFTMPSILPVESRTLFITETRTIDPPSPRFLAIHAAIAHILHLSGAGGYVDDILYDLDRGGGEVMADGSTPLGVLTSLRVGGWWNGQPVGVF